MKYNKKLNFVKIDRELLSLKELDGDEKIFLSLVNHYTFCKKCNGRMYMTNEEMSDLLGLSVRKIQRIKEKLKKLNLIETNGGIECWSKRKG